MNAADNKDLGMDLQVVVPTLTPEQISVVMGVLTSLQIALYDAYQQAIRNEAWCEDEPPEFDPFEIDEDVPF